MPQTFFCFSRFPYMILQHSGGLSYRQSIWRNLVILRGDGMCFALSRPGAPTCLASGSVRTRAFGFHLGPKGFFRTENMITENMISCFRALFMRLIVSHYGFSNTTISTICLGRSQTIFSSTARSA